MVLLLPQLSRDRIGYYETKRPEVVLEAPERPFDFAWPQPEELRAAGGSGSLLQLKGVSYTYPGAAAPVLHVSVAAGHVLGTQCVNPLRQVYLNQGLEGTCQQWQLVATRGGVVRIPRSIGARPACG